MSCHKLHLTVWKWNSQMSHVMQFISVSCYWLGCFAGSCLCAGFWLHAERLRIWETFGCLRLFAFTELNMSHKRHTPETHTGVMWMCVSLFRRVEISNVSTRRRIEIILKVWNWTARTVQQFAWGPRASWRQGKTSPQPFGLPFGSLFSSAIPPPWQRMLGKLNSPMQP